MPPIWTMFLREFFDARDSQNMCDPWGPTKKRPRRETFENVCLHMVIFCFKRTTYRNLEIRCVSTSPDVFWWLFMLIQLIHLMFFSQGWFLDPESWKTYSHLLGEDDPIWRSYFSDGLVLQSPTRFFRANTKFGKTWECQGGAKTQSRKENFVKRSESSLAILRKRDLCCFLKMVTLGFHHH